MKIIAESPDHYLTQLPKERQGPVQKLRTTVLDNLPEGFVETISYGMLGYVVPHSIYPAGYHCDPKLPLPFLNIASQKNFVSLYHMGIYAKPKLMEWFVAEYPKHCKRKLDMGKSCIRFKKMEEIPYALIAELVRKMTMEEWVGVYEQVVRGK